MSELLTNLQDFTKDWLELRIGTLKDNIEAEIVIRLAHLMTQVGQPGHLAALISHNTMMELRNSVVNHERGYAGNVEQFQPSIFTE
jgi:predicted O-linked N-acetylglucosamine transferase (SPINDLY family)